MVSITQLRILLLVFVTLIYCSNSAVISVSDETDNQVLNVILRIRNEQLNCDYNEYYDFTVQRCVSCSDLCDEPNKQRSCSVLCPGTYVSKYILQTGEQNDVFNNKQQIVEKQTMENENSVAKQITTLRYAIWVCLISVITLFMVCITIIIFTEFKKPQCCKTSKCPATKQTHERKSNETNTQKKKCRNVQEKRVKSDRERLVQDV
uniref:Uncharacterized LOC100176446 n=1 Tax=Ciona intestinalis TaxID=7719 RepID=F6QCK3_CIOIN|nr:uncharacterized protein LOC100176446 [Ciona intestinalis]|eukprot:XP_002121137.1 uncharacterized protein LOC100176446 [Ciona intestinalis]